MNECIFCQIIEGKIPSKKVYEDDICIAILDIRPLNKGHMLLIPKEHYQIAPQVPKPVMQHMGIVCKKLSKASLRGFKAQGTNIFMANGAIAGQQMPHVVVHIIPRFENDKVEVFNLSRNKVEQSQIEQMSTLLKEYIEKKSQMPEQEVAMQQTQSQQPEHQPQPQEQQKPSGGVDLDSISNLF